MSAAKHTPAGVELSLRIGQRVRHQDYKGQRVTGVVVGMTACVERGLMVDCALDAPIVIPPGDGHDEVRLYHQHAPAHEFVAFDDRDEVIAALQAALADLVLNVSEAMKTGGWVPAPLHQSFWESMEHAHAAIAKATGSAS